MPGLGPTGFEIATLGEILAEIRTDIWTGISDQMDLSSESPIGGIVGAVSERYSLLWQALQAVYDAFTPDGSSGSSLTKFSNTTGTERKSATKTLVFATVNLDAGFSQAAGAMVAHVTGDPTARFVNRSLVENPGGSPDDIEAEFEAETAGELEVLSGTLTVIAEPITGWNTITNALDGITGDPDETDASLRLRREAELRAQGSTTRAAVEADVLRELSDNITHCRVLENDTASTDSNGLPPKSLEVIARGQSTTDAESDRLARQILESKSGGIQAYGTTTRTVEDSQGNEYQIGLTWVSTQSVYLEIDVTIDSSQFPVDGDDQIEAALIAVEESYAPGDDVIAQRLKAAAFTVSGVVDVIALRLGFSASPVGTSNLTVAIREIADFDTSRITVAHV